VARIHELIRQVDAQSPDLARELAREIDVLSERRAFGLNFERHTPEEVELPGRPVRRGDKVHVLPSRGETPKAANKVMWVVEAIDRATETATIGRVDAKGTLETRDVALADLVVVAEFRDPIHPGLVSTGKIERGGDKPYHSVINGENFHALQTLLFTHRGKVDVIYIDPPYNTGARDWKYNNDYVESDDQYRHSKWLAFIERRLVLAKDMLNPEDSVLVVTIDEHEVAHLGVLLEQVFPEADITLVTIVMMPKGVTRPGTRRFSRVEEYAYFCFFGNAGLSAWDDDLLTLGADDLEKEAAAADASARRRPRWKGLLRSGTNARRRDRRFLFYPVLIDVERGAVLSAGEPLLPVEKNGSLEWPEPNFETKVDGLTPVWPVRKDGTLGNWGISAPTLRAMAAKGYVKLGGYDEKRNTWGISYLSKEPQEQITAGILEVAAYDEQRNVVDAVYAEADSPARRVKRVWHRSSHDAGSGGTDLITAFLGGRAFPFAKSIYAVRDTLGILLADKPDAVIADFFAGSGTTMHATMLLNAQDGRGRQCILVTNNEVEAERTKELNAEGHYRGNSEFEREGIFEAVTVPRVKAAISGKTPEGNPIEGYYKVAGEFPMADGFAENVEFFTLTYEEPLRVALRLDFPKVAPLLWLRAGSAGRRIETLDAGWDVADTYGVLADLDKSEEFVSAIADAPDVRVAFVITDEDRLFEAVVRDLPDHVEPVRMYDAYLRNFELESRVPW
jgi:adenine-specific DNA-methyltransferase